MFILKILGEFRGKNLIFEKFWRLTIYFLKTLENFKGNIIKLEKFESPWPHLSKWVHPCIQVNASSKIAKIRVPLFWCDL